MAQRRSLFSSEILAWPLPIFPSNGRRRPRRRFVNARRERRRRKESLMKLGAKREKGRGNSVTASTKRGREGEEKTEKKKMARR